MVRVSIRTSWVVNFALFRCYRPAICTRPDFGQRTAIAVLLTYLLGTHCRDCAKQL